MSTSCCHSDKNSDHNHDHSRKSFDWILYGSMGVIVVGLALSFVQVPVPGLQDFSQTTVEFLKTMAPGIAVGAILVGVMSKIPREYFSVLMGKSNSTGGIFRAALAGLVLDLCSHGILLVGAKLYERGVGLAQIMTFLIASPWNSLSLTIILVTLIGLKWTLLYVAGSALIAIASGFIYQALVRSGKLPSNPNETEASPDFNLMADAKKRLKAFRPSKQFFYDITIGSWNEVRMLLRWLLLGVVLASLINAYVPTDFFNEWFGPSMIGLALTLVAATIIEVCSEGSAPIASEIFTRAAAPGNAFAFLMAGVSTDYTEMMIIRQFSQSWKVTFSLPLITLPQIILLGMIMNWAGGG